MQTAGSQSVMLGKPDYRDNFLARRAESDDRTALEWFRAAFEDAPWPVRWFLLAGWRCVLLLHLELSGSSGNILGWRIFENQASLARLQTESRLMTSRLSLELAPDSTAVWTTELWYRSRTGRVLWTFVGILHRRIVPHRLRQAAKAGRNH